MRWENAFHCEAQMKRKHLDATAKRVEEVCAVEDCVCDRCGSTDRVAEGTTRKTCGLKLCLRCVQEY